MIKVYYQIPHNMQPLTVVNVYPDIEQLDIHLSMLLEQQVYPMSKDIRIEADHDWDEVARQSIRGAQELSEKAGISWPV